MALEGNVKTPLGDVKKKTALLIGAGGLGVLGIVWYRSKQQAAQNASQSSADASQSGSDQIDPATGYPYGSPEDVAAQSQIGAASGQYGPLYDYGLGGGGGYNPNQVNGPGSFTSNAAWAQYAEDYMANTLGESATDVGNALGKYITGQPVTDAQVALINQAIAFAGSPPVPGTDGFPPSIRNAPPVPNPPPGPHPGGGNAQNPVKGLTVDARFTQADVKWSPSKGATGYRVRLRSWPANKIVQEYNISGTSVTFHNLQKRGRYEINVLAQPAAANATVAKKVFSER